MPVQTTEEKDKPKTRNGYKTRQRIPLEIQRTIDLLDHGTQEQKQRHTQASTEREIQMLQKHKKIMMKFIVICGNQRRAN